MKLCVFSDIHGNGHAFRPAFEQILSEGADAHLFLGDLCGYYFDQLEIFRMIRSIPNLIALQGNHDRMFIEIIEGHDLLRKRYADRFGKSMEFLLKRDFKELYEWLKSVSEEYTDPMKRFACYHGSPVDPLNGYIYPDNDVQFEPPSACSFIFLGHTHHRMKKAFKGGLIINPGSLGQPRDGRWPSYALFDTDSLELQFREVRYDTEALINQVNRHGDQNGYLIDVISRYADS